LGHTRSSAFLDQHVNHSIDAVPTGFDASGSIGGGFNCATRHSDECRGGLPEIIADRRTGLLVNKENPEGLANAIEFLFDHPEQAVQIGQAARSRVQRKFNWKRHVDSYDMLYRRLANSS
jgi:hypothetical protein